MKHTHFKHIGLIGRPGKETTGTLEHVKNYLLEKQVLLTIEYHTSQLISSSSLPTFTPQKLPKSMDLIIVVGGDGSLLNAAHLALPHELPVLGINRGRLGFLTDIHPNELSRIGDVLMGEYQTDPRFVLKTAHFYQQAQKHEDLALNDVVLLPGDLAQMIEFDISIDDHFVCHQRADGLIIGTPTGSTAYALSGGGPILHPQLNAIVLVPMFPHTLSSRPIVVSGDAKIELHISELNETSPYISCDGQRRIAVNPGSSLIITKYEKQLNLIHPKNYEYFTTLREKLGWQSQHKAKE